MTPEHYPLKETATADYPERTEANVRAADATLIFTRGKPDRGTALTYELARRLNKPCYLVDLGAPAFPEERMAMPGWIRKIERGFAWGVTQRRELRGPLVGTELSGCKDL